MPIRYEDEVIHMNEYCAIDEAEELLKFLEEHPHARVNLAQCQHMHTALLQLLMTYGVRIEGEAFTPFMWKWIVPTLRARGG